MSTVIVDMALTTHGALDIQEACPHRTCEKEEDTIMIQEVKLAKDIKPRFELYDKEGKRMRKEEKLLKQPQQVITHQHSIIFLLPQQTHAEKFMIKGYKV